MSNAENNPSLIDKVLLDWQVNHYTDGSLDGYYLHHFKMNKIWICAYQTKSYQSHTQYYRIDFRSAYPSLVRNNIVDKYLPKYDGLSNSFQSLQEAKDFLENILLDNGFKILKGEMSIYV